MLRFGITLPGCRVNASLTRATELYAFSLSSGRMCRMQPEKSIITQRKEPADGARPSMGYHSSQEREDSDWIQIIIMERKQCNLKSKREKQRARTESDESSDEVMFWL